MAAHIKANERDGLYVYCRWVYRNGKKIYPKNGKVFRFPVRDNIK